MKYPAYPKYKDSGVAWLGEVPEHWNVYSLKRLVRLKSGEMITADRIEEDGPFPVFGGNGLRGYTSSFTHDGFYVLIGRQGALCGNINYAFGKFWASEHAIVISPVCAIDAKWIGHLLWAMNLNQYSISAAQPGLSIDVISNLSIPVPPVSEQNAIANYLDANTGKFDALIAKKRELIAKLQEKRAALITRTVTRGLPPEAAKAAGLDPHPKMKDSGVEWLGEVPEHWGVIPLGYLVRILGGGTPDKSNTDYWDGDIPWVSPKDMKRKYIADTVDHISQEAVDNGPTSLLPLESVLIVVRGMILLHSFPIAISKSILTINQDMKALVCLKKVLPEFLYYVLAGSENIFVSSADESAHGTRKIETSIISHFPVVLPSLEEQVLLAGYLNAEIAKIDSLVAHIETVTQRLQEYRSALITAAVTGKIDVRNAPSEAA